MSFQFEFDFENRGRKSTITLEEVKALVAKSLEDVKELEEILDEVFTLPPTARTLILR